MWKKIIIIVVLMALLFLVIYFNGDFEKDNQEIQQVQQEEQTENLETLDVKWQYNDGTHIFVGKEELPSPCHAWQVEVKDTDNPDRKVINLESFKMETDGDDQLCAQVMTPRIWSREYKGPKDLEFGIYKDGAEYRINIFEIPSDKNIYEIELFNKG